MQYSHIHFLAPALWAGARLRRSEELTPVFIDRYLGPRQFNKPTCHDFWELTCALSGAGILRCGEDFALVPGVLCLIPPGLDHLERADGSLDTIWIGLKGRHLNAKSLAQAARIQNQALAGRMEQLWLFAIRQSGLIGPELDALTAGIVAHFLRLLTEGVEISGAADALERAILSFQRNFSQKLTIADTARQIGYSTGHFCRAFKKRTGQAPIEYLAAVRLRHARRLLEYTDLPIAQVASQAGYEDALYFSRVFRKVSGLTPTAYRHRVRRSAEFLPNTSEHRE